MEPPRARANAVVLPFPAPVEEELTGAVSYAGVTVYVTLRAGEAPSVELMDPQSGRTLTRDLSDLFAGFVSEVGPLQSTSSSP